MIYRRGQFLANDRLRYLLLMKQLLIGVGFRADIIVENIVIVELKSVDDI